MGVLSPVLLHAENTSVPVWVFGVAVNAQTA
jgi:hypothetical protein